MARTDGRFSDYIIIETGRPFYAFIDMYKDEGMKKLKEHEIAGTLPEPKNPTVQPKAYLHQKVSMLVEEVTNEYGDTVKRFKDSVILAEADERGRIFLPKEEKELARRILKVLKRIDKGVGVDSASILTEEEIMGPVEQNKGGRPRKPTR